MTHGTVEFRDGMTKDAYEVLDAGGRNGPTTVLKCECIEAGQKHELGDVVTFDVLELDNRQDVTVYDHKGDETTALQLAARLAADSELPDE